MFEWFCYLVFTFWGLNPGPYRVLSNCVPRVVGLTFILTVLIEYTIISMCAMCSPIRPHLLSLKHMHTKTIFK